MPLFVTSLQDWLTGSHACPTLTFQLLTSRSEDFTYPINAMLVTVCRERLRCEHQCLDACFTMTLIHWAKDYCLDELTDDTKPVSCSWLLELVFIEGAAGGSLSVLATLTPQNSGMLCSPHAEAARQSSARLPSSRPSCACRHAVGLLQYLVTRCFAECMCHH